MSGYFLPKDPQAIEPPWMVTARSLIGQREIPGLVTAGFITKMLAGLHAWWKDDETAWCATFVSWCLHDAGLDYPKAFYRARAYAAYGRSWAIGHDWPAYGAIAVLDRPPKPTEGHVAFYVGPAICFGCYDHFSPGSPVRLRSCAACHGLGRVYLLGGNQDNQVCVRSYSAARVLSYRWPTAFAVPHFTPDAAMLAAMVANSPTARTDA